MTHASLTLDAVFLLVLLVCVKPVGLYIAHVMEGRPIWPLRMGASAERGLYRLCGIDPAAQMGWKQYMIALLIFNGEVWGPDRAQDARSLRVFMRSLRAKLEPDPRRPCYLLTETGLGYRLCTPETMSVNCAPSSAPETTKE